jgi:hypothetical protein
VELVNQLLSQGEFPGVTIILYYLEESYHIFRYII